MSDPMLAEVLRAVNDMRGDLRGHIEEETDEIKSFTEAFHQHRASSERRHSALINSINSYMERQTEIEEAFLTREGKKDFIGHKTDHELRLERSQTWRRRFDTIMTTVMVSATVGALAWVGTLVWKGFLAGPVGK